jgi:Uma2 family endonuclease
MATAPESRVHRTNDYPTTDGKPMAETDLHRELMNALIQTLKAYYAAEPQVYVSGNLLLFYQPGNRRRHISPDVFVVKGVSKRDRLNYLVWEEGKGPDVVIELTSSSTRHEDQHRKFQRYQDVLRVPEYFLFDPMGDYLEPRLQGYRLRRGGYAAIRPVRRRLPSQVLGLHLEAAGNTLRLYDPATEEWLLTPQERVTQSEERLAEVEAENERLRRELEQLRRGRR